MRGVANTFATGKHNNKENVLKKNGLAAFNTISKTDFRDASYIKFNYFYCFKKPLNQNLRD